MRENFKSKTRDRPVARAAHRSRYCSRRVHVELASAEAAQHELTLMMRNRDLLKKDIQRARDIRKPHSRHPERL